MHTRDTQQNDTSGADCTAMHFILRFDRFIRVKTRARFGR